jgi:GxxExxY protein
MRNNLQYKELSMSQPINLLTQTVIGRAFAVHNELGTGYLEKVYEQALLWELRESGIAARSQTPIPVYYKGIVVGDYFADLLIEEQLVIEIKAVQQIAKEHEVQLVNYLTATGIEDGLLINFGPSVQVRRKYRLLGQTRAPIE